LDKGLVMVAPIRCHPHSIWFDKARFSADVIVCISLSNEAMASNSFQSDFIYGKGIRASEPRLRSPDRGARGLVRGREL